MKKILRIMTAVALLSVIGFGIAFAATGFDGTIFPEVLYASADGDFTEKNTDFLAEDISEIIVKGRSERVVLTNGAEGDDKVHIKYFESDYKTSTVTSADGKLSIVTRREETWFNYKIQSRKTDFIEIKIPADYAGKIDLATFSNSIEATCSNTFESVKLLSKSGKVVTSGLKSAGNINIETTSDNISVADTEALDLTVSNRSGRITLTNISAQSITATSSSDKIKLVGVEAVSVYAKTSSGAVEVRDSEMERGEFVSSSDNIKLFGVRAESVFVKTSSGKIEALGCVFGEGEFKTSSDNIELDIDCKDISAITSSGSITIRAKGSASDFLMEVSTHSGNIRIDGQKHYPGTYNHGAENRIVARTSSANVRIDFY